jgi:hypothetical protein
MYLSSQQFVSGICGAGIVLLCELEYTCWRLFKRRTTLFFFVTQLAILSSTLVTALASLVFFIPSLEILPILIAFALAKFIADVTYPTMMLLRLKLICNIPTVIMYIPLLQGIIWMVLKYFWISWVLTSNSYYCHVYFIIQLTSTVCFTVQSVAINIFFAVVAVKKFEDVIHIRYVIIVSIIVIIIECLVATAEFVYLINWISWIIIAIGFQIRVRLEMGILAYIAEDATPTPYTNLSNFVRGNLSN